MQPNKMPGRIISINNFADLLGVSRATVDIWIRSGKYPVHTLSDGKRYFYLDDVKTAPEVAAMLSTKWNDEIEVTPSCDFTLLNFSQVVAVWLLEWKRPVFTMSS